MTLMLSWERNRYQYGYVSITIPTVGADDSDMVFTRQIDYLTRYIE